MGPVYTHWARTDPLGLLEILTAGSGSLERESQAREFINAWGAENPEQALAALERLSALFARPAEQLAGIRDDLLAAWLAKDEDAPFEWIEALDDAAEREALMESLVTARLKQGSAGEAVDYILDRPGEGRLQESLAEYWREWATSAPVEALARMGALPEEHRFWHHDAAAVAQSSLVMATLTNQTAEVVGALDQIPEGPRRLQLLLGMIQGASSNDLGLARSLMERLPESREREEAAGWMMGAWVKSDLAAAGAWLQGQAPSASRDAATSSFSLGLVSENPALAAQWTEVIGNAPQRSRTREQIFARWRERDAEAADAWRATWE
jgi:hypothetical protein